jgi:hypothetical protein
VKAFAAGHLEEAFKLKIFEVLAYLARGSFDFGEQ